MKKLKTLLILTLCILFMPFPKAEATDFSYDVYILDTANYASILGISEKTLNQVIDDIYSAIADYEDSCQLFFYNIRYSTTAYKCFNEIILGNPEIFNINNITCYYSFTGYISHIEFHYLYTREDYEKKLEAVRKTAQELVSGITEEMPDELKVLLIHDRLATLCEYDYENLLNDTIAFESYTLYGVLEKRLAVCQGYARAMDYLLRKVGVNSYACVSDDLNHMWNIVYIDGEKYHVDTTWDDPVIDIMGRVLHRNFLLSTDAFKNSYPNGHSANDYDSSPDSTLYDNAFWQSSDAQFCLVGDKVFYFDSKNSALCEYDFKTDVSTTLLTLKSKWPASANSYWTGNYTRLATNGKLIYYSLPDGIYSYNPTTGVNKPVFRPDMSGHDFFAIYGFTLKENQLICEAYSSPNVTLTTVGEIYTYTISSRITGDVTGNGKIEVDDALHTLRAAVNLVSLSAEDFDVADIDGDGLITVSDSLHILSMAISRK